MIKLQSTSPITLNPTCLSNITNSRKGIPDYYVRNNLQTQAVIDSRTDNINLRKVYTCKAGPCCKNAQNKSNMAAPKLTTCQLPPCSNPSFETFVAARASVYEGNDKEMSVIDILNDIKTSENKSKSYQEERRNVNMNTFSKPVVCPKVRMTISCTFDSLVKVNST